MEFKKLGLAILASSIANLITTTILAMCGYGASSIAIGVIAGLVTQIAYYAIYVPKYFCFRLSVTGWPAIARFGLEMVTISGVSTITKRVCELIIGAFVGTNALGLFTRATNIADTLFSGIYGAGTKVIFSNLCRVRRDGLPITAPFLYSFEILLSIFWPVVAGIAVLSGPIILLLYGEAWLPAAPVLSVLMIGQLVALTFALNWELFVISEKTGMQVRYEMIRSVVSLGAFAAGSYFGLVGAASGRFVDAAIGMLLYIPAYRWLVPVSKHVLFRVYFRCAFATLVAIFPALCSMILFDWNADIPWTNLGTCIVLGIIGWAAAHYFMGSALMLLFANFIKPISKDRLNDD